MEDIEKYLYDFMKKKKHNLENVKKKISQIDKKVKKLKKDN